MTLNKQVWEKIKQLFAQVFELPENERASYLQQHCSDTFIRKEVELLLRKQHTKDNFLELPQPITGNPFTNFLQPGQKVKDYIIIDKIGEGGFGVVFRALQKKPKRIVAMKLIRPLLADQEVSRRFEQEIQILGWLKHPGIAQIIEAGTTETPVGTQSFLVMELVEGEPLLEYLKKLQPNTKEKLDLFVQICEAVHYAHQRGVIHRDLKPNNILINELGQPKILDFGIARLSNISNSTMHTLPGKLLGTLQYMSPEQITETSQEIDTRSDLYALAVIGYQMLTGDLPYDLLDRSFGGALRVISEAEPKPLSDFVKQYRGDLQTIFAKALEKDKERRYAAVIGFIEDIHRYLHNEPITARPATTFYQLKKFARRHRALVIGVAAAMVILIGGVFTTSWQAARANRLAGLEKTARINAEQISNFFQQALASVDPTANPGEEPSLKEFLQQTAQQLNSRLDLDPLVEAPIRATLGNVYQNLGLYPQAEEHFLKVLQLRQGLQLTQDTEVAKAYADLALLYLNLEKHDQGEKYTQTAIQIYKELQGEKNVDVAKCLALLGQYYMVHDSFDDARIVLQKSLQIRKEILGENHLVVAGSLLLLGGLEQKIGNAEKALDFYRLAQPILESKVSKRHPDYISVLLKVAEANYALGEFQTTISLLEEALQLSEQVYTQQHPIFGTIYNDLGVAYMSVEPLQLAKAEQYLVKATELGRDFLPAEHSSIGSSFLNLAGLFAQNGDFQKANQYFQQALNIAEIGSGRKSLDFSITLANYSNFCLLQQEYAKAENGFAEAIQIMQSFVNKDNPELLTLQHNLAMVYFKTERMQLAENLYQEVFKLRAEKLGTDADDTIWTKNGLAYVYFAQKKFEQAKELFEECSYSLAQKYSTEHWKYLIVRNSLGSCLIRLGQYAEAEKVLQESYRIFRSQFGDQDQRTLETLDKLVDLYASWDQPNKAEDYRERLTNQETHPGMMGIR